MHLCRKQLCSHVLPEPRPPPETRRVLSFALLHAGETHDAPHARGREAKRKEVCRGHASLQPAIPSPTRQNRGEEHCSWEGDESCASAIWDLAVFLVRVRCQRREENGALEFCTATVKLLTKQGWPDSAGKHVGARSTEACGPGFLERTCRTCSPRRYPSRGTVSPPLGHPP